MTVLLDIHVLIALLDPSHIHHHPAHDWFAHEGHRSWASCPITQNGALRILSHSSYPGSPGAISSVQASLESLFTLPGHSFWPDDISLFDRQAVHKEHILSAAQITDSYLLGLARAHGGTLVTFDRKIPTRAIPDGQRHLRILS